MSTTMPANHTARSLTNPCRRARVVHCAALSLAPGGSGILRASQKDQIAAREAEDKRWMQELKEIDDKRFQLLLHVPRCDAALEESSIRLWAEKVAKLK